MLPRIKTWRRTAPRRPDLPVSLTGDARLTADERRWLEEELETNLGE